MTATTSARLTKTKGRVPQLATYPIAASTRLLKGTVGQRDANDRVVGGADGNGLPAIGRISATYDNSSGAAGDLDAQIEYGVFGWAGEAGALPTVGDRCYVADNQTVSTDPKSSAGAQRGYAGRCVEVRDSLYWVQMGPQESADGGAFIATYEDAWAYDDTDVAVAATSMTRNVVTDLPAGALVVGVECNTSVDWSDGGAGAFHFDLGDGTDDDEYAADVGNIDNGVSRVGASVQLALDAAGDLVMTLTGDVNLDTLTGGASTVKVFVALP